MQAFKTTYVLETKRALNKKAIGLFLFISLLSLYFVQTGVGKYKNMMQSRYTFQDFERLKVKQYLNYNQYGAHGFRILFIPSPLSIYFVNSSAITELTANVDSGEQLNIYNSFKGKLLFAEKSGGLKDFSGFLLLLGSLLILYFGYEAFIYKDYLRFMSGFIDYKRFFFAIVLSRMFIFIFFFLLNAGFSIVLLGINGIRLSKDDLLHALIYVGVLALMMMFFFIVGTVACSFNSNFAGLIMIIVSWFTLVYLIPGAVNTVIYQKADRIIPGYQLELQKLKNLLEFERRAFEETGTTNTPNQGNIDERENTMRAGDFNDKRFRQIQALEERLANEMSKNISDFQTLSAFFPSTFYLSVGNEIGGNGYENFTRFFEYIRALKIEFVKFYLDHKYNPKYNSSAVESFIKNDENLFMAKGLVPHNILSGISIMFVYIAGLLVLSYRRSRKSLKL